MHLFFFGGGGVLYLLATFCNIFNFASNIYLHKSQHNNFLIVISWLYLLHYFILFY